jgi:hypothetical protein
MLCQLLLLRKNTEVHGKFTGYNFHLPPSSITTVYYTVVQCRAYVGTQLLTSIDQHRATTCCQQCCLLQLLRVAVTGTNTAATVARVCDSAAPVLMQCPAGTKIVVNDAVYTRPADTSCPGPAGACSIANVASIIKTRCNGYGSCVLTGDTYLTNNPCSTVLKELRVDYVCSGELADSGNVGRCVLGCMLHAW